MKDHTRLFPRLGSVLVLTLTLLCSSAAAQSNSLSGSFGFLLNHSGGLAVLGVMNFDGAGNVTGTYTARSNGGHPQSTGTFTGTYSSMPNGVGLKPGSITIANDTGVTFSLDMVFTDGGQFPGHLDTTIAALLHFPRANSSHPARLLQTAALG